MKKLLVTGITGHSGGYFLQELIRNAEKEGWVTEGCIKAVVRPHSQTSAIDQSGLNIEKCVGNLDDKEFLQKAMNGVDTVVHIAGIHWSLNVAEAAAASRVRRLVMVHTTGIYSKYKNAGENYRQIDKTVEQLAEDHRIDLTILRPTMIYGSAKDNNIIVFIRMVDKFIRIPIVNHAGYMLQPVHAKDLGIAYYQVLTHEEACRNKNYVLSGKQPVMLLDMLNVIKKHLGCEKKGYLSIPFFMAYSGAWVVYLLTFGKKDIREKVQRLCESRAYPHDEASRDFGFRPLSFEEGIVMEINEYLNQKNESSI